MSSSFICQTILISPFHCWSVCFNRTRTHWSECNALTLCTLFLRGSICWWFFLVAAGSDLEHAGCLTKDHTQYTHFLRFRIEIYPSIFHWWKCSFSLGLCPSFKAIISQHTSQIFLFLSFVLLRYLCSIHPTCFFGNSYKAIEPWVSEISFYQLDGLLCALVLLLSVYATSLLPVKQQSFCFPASMTFCC